MNSKKKKILKGWNKYYKKKYEKRSWERYESYSPKRSHKGSYTLDIFAHKIALKR
jgi:hypothetical protein